MSRTNNYDCTSFNFTVFLDLLKATSPTSDLRERFNLNLYLCDLEERINIQIRMMTRMMTRTNAAAAPTDIPIISAIPIMKQLVLKSQCYADTVE